MIRSLTLNNFSRWRWSIFRQRKHSLAECSAILVSPDILKAQIFFTCLRLNATTLLIKQRKWSDKLLIIILALH